MNKAEGIIRCRKGELVNSNIILRVILEKIHIILDTFICRKVRTL
jgi:hypothetical protein